ncbi:MAG: AraC family transcriptional regulator [Shinella sp.]|nr:AraC family transcriptional regulator [Shinella sp.]
MSVQSEVPYTASFKAVPSILIAVVNGGAIRANVRVRENTRNVQGPPGVISILPDRTAFGMDLRSRINTTHLYLRRALLDDVAGEIYPGDPAGVELITRLAIFDPVLEQLCYAIRDALDEDPVSSSLYVDHMARAVAARLIRKHSSAAGKRTQGPSNEGLSARLLERTREIVEARLESRLTTTDIAAGTGIGADHFGRLFKQATGMTLYQFVIRCRVDRAGRMLADTTKPIIQIAYECGFADQVHLTRAFGRIVGRTPAAFRKEHRK